MVVIVRLVNKLAPKPTIGIILCRLSITLNRFSLLLVYFIYKYNKGPILANPIYPIANPIDNWLDQYPNYE